MLVTRPSLVQSGNSKRSERNPELVFALSSVEKTSIDLDPSRGKVEISITVGTGDGPNPLAAFDRALHDAGIANFNLVVLSSVIPPGSTILQKQACLNEDDWGARLYVVLARREEAQESAQAWAGIGWVQDEETGKGLFVEHDGGSRNEVEIMIEESLESMVTYRSTSFGPPQMAVTGTECRDRPVCALVAATYLVDPWN